MGIQINGNTNNINAGIGSLSIEDIHELDLTGIATASNFKTGSSNLHSTGLTVGNALVHSTGVNVGTGATVHCPATNILTFGTNSSERARIDSSGRVLIGTTTEGSSASDDLTIATSGTTGITIRSGTSNNGNIEFSDGTSGQDEYRGVVQYAHSDNSMRFYTDAEEKVRITSGGRFLVGVSTSNTGGSYSSVVSSGAAANNGGFQAHFSGANNGGGGSMTTINAVGGGLDFWTYTGNVGASSYSRRLRIDSSGRVLIGTTDPGGGNADDLTVATSGNTGITIRSGTSNTGNIFFSDATSGAAQYAGAIEFHHSDNSLRLNVGNTNYFRIASNGAVSINYAGAGDNTLHIGNTSNAGGIIIKSPGNHYSNMVIDSNRSGANNGIFNLVGRWNGNDVAYMTFTTGTDTTNKDDGYIRMYTRESGQSLTERVQIKEAGGFVSNKGGGNIAFSDGYSAIEARAPEGTTQLTVTNTTYESGTFDNEAGIWFKGNYSGNNERAKTAIIHKNTGDYGVGDLYFCLDGNGDNSNATVSDVKMKIDSSGRVTKPNTPGFLAYHYGHDINYGPNATLPYPFTTFNTGNHYNTSNSTFTAPVAGRYLFSANANGNYSSSYSGIPRAYWKINGSNVGNNIHLRGPDSTDQGLEQRSQTVIFNLAANDTVKIVVGQNQWDLFGANSFTGYLIG